jgi:hypothetical protein
MNHIRTDFLMLAFTASMLLGVSIAVTPAPAASIQYSFTGDVDRVAPRLSSTFNTTQLMSGLVTVDTSGTIGHPGIGTYTITNFSLDIGGYHATMGPSGQVQIVDRLNGLDRFNVTVNNPNGPSVHVIHPVATFTPSVFDIHLRGPASIFSSDALPTTPSISAFTNFNQWRLVFGPNGKVVAGTVTALTAVPLPAAVILFGAGLVALVGLGAGSWRQKKHSLA